MSRDRQLPPPVERPPAEPAPSLWPQTPKMARPPGGPSDSMPTDDGGVPGPTEVTPGRLSGQMGRYQLLSELGRGGMGVVFRAWDPLLKREVALKVLRDAYLAEDSVRQRLLREATAVARIRHPHIVEVYDFGQEEGHLFFTMRLVEGYPLAARLREGKVPPMETARIIAQVAQALQHAHDQGLIHRDVKPGNILIDASGEAVLTDFGLVKELDSEDSALTRDTQLLGTPAYMAPEQIRDGTRTASALSDQYALGVVLYQMLKGWPPYYGATPMEIWRRVLKEDPPPIAGSDIPPELAAVTMKAMAREPEDRYPCAEELARDLERFQNGERVLASQLGMRRRVQLGMRRHQRSLLVVLLAMGVFALAMVGRVAWDRIWAWREASAREGEAAERLSALDLRLDELERAGEHEEVDRLFSNFSSFERNAETAALARAWLTQGARLDARGDATRARIARGTAYVLAQEPALQAEALLGLARGYREHLDWTRLRQTLGAIGASSPEHAALPELGTWKRDLLVFEHDLQGALALTQDAEERALLSALSQVTHTPHAGWAALTFDLERDGQIEILMVDPPYENFLLLDPRPDLPLRSRQPTAVPLSMDSWLLPVGRGRTTPLLVRNREGDCEVLDALEGRLTSIGRFPCTILRGTVTVDLEKDGTYDTFITDDRLFGRLIHDARGWRIEGAHSATNGSNSESTQMWVRDLDQDGQDELVLTTSMWGAYDVRVLNAVGGDLKMRSRLRLGENTSMVVLETRKGPRVGVYQAHDPNVLINIPIFGESAPHGAPQGLHIVAYDKGALSSEQVLPLRGGSHAVSSGPHAADLDGDGDSEILHGYDGKAMMVYLARDDGSFTPFVVEGLVPLLTVNLDDDPASELIARDNAGKTYVFGAGSDPQPPLTPGVVVPRAPVPAEVPDSLAGPWSRAEDLVDLGLIDVAVERFLVLATLEPGGRFESLARMRAAKLLEDSLMPGRAGEEYVIVADDPDVAAEAWESAFRCFLLDRRFDDALAAGRARLGMPDPPAELSTRLEALEAELSAAPLSLDLVNQLDPRVQLRSALDLRWSSSSDGLQVRALGHEELLRLPLRNTGGPVAISITIQMDRMDWGSSITLQRTLLDGGNVLQSPLALASGGGGGIFKRWFSCEDVMSSHPLTGNGLTPGKPVTIRWEGSPDGSGASCSMSQDSKQIFRAVSSKKIDPWKEADQPYWLTLSSTSYESVLTFTLENITLEGVEIVSAPEDPLAPVHRELVRGDPEKALALLDVMGGREPRALLARALALDSLDRDEEATRLLTAAVGLEGERFGDAIALLVLHPERFGPKLRAAFGLQNLPTLARGLETLAYMHREDASVRELLTTQLVGLETIPLGPRTQPEYALSVLWPLAFRGHAWLASGRPALAERDLAQVTRVGQQLRGLTPENRTLTEDWGRLLASAWQGTARLHFEAGDPEAAFQDLERALASHPSPQTYADVLSLWPPLEGMRALPGWKIVENARRSVDLER